MRAAGSLGHPNVVPIFAMGRYRGLWYYAMELVTGKPLDRVIEDRRRAGSAERPTWAELAGTFAGAADALEAAHRSPGRDEAEGILAESCRLAGRSEYGTIYGPYGDVP